MFLLFLFFLLRVPCFCFSLKITTKVLLEIQKESKYMQTLHLIKQKFVKNLAIIMKLILEMMQTLK